MVSINKEQYEPEEPIHTEVVEFRKSPKDRSFADELEQIDAVKRIKAERMQAESLCKNIFLSQLKGDDPRVLFETASKKKGLAEEVSDIYDSLNVYYRMEASEDYLTFRGYNNTFINRLNLAAGSFREEQ